MIIKIKRGLVFSVFIVALSFSSAENKTVKSFIPEKFSFCDESKQVSIGIDISRYQNVNFSLLDSGISFIFCKATEGTTIVDRKFATHWSQIGDKYSKGAYHYFRPLVSGKEQAKLFLNTVNFSSGHMLPVIDVELGRGYNAKNSKIYVSNLKQMIRYIEEKLGVKPIIYTNTHFWNHNFAVHFKDMAKEYHLWVADYRDREEPSVPVGWENWSIWQHSCKGKLNGIPGEVDLNVCKVDINKLLIP